MWSFFFFFCHFIFGQPAVISHIQWLAVPESRCLLYLPVLNIRNSHTGKKCFSQVFYWGFRVLFLKYIYYIYLF